MYSKSVIVKNEVGLYGKAATDLIQIANIYKCSIFIEHNDKKVNAKSLLGVLSLGLTKNTEIVLIGEGCDEKEAIERIADFLDSGKFDLNDGYDDDDY
ncbi:MAG: HPr family phosphocarrier protein [Firmicutes bacterium]|nr:HPr family phosphocarrier protein [Bacillota bacterium]